MSTVRMLRVVWFLGGVALVLAFARDGLAGLTRRPRELPRADGATGRPWITGDFAPTLHNEVNAGRLPAHIQRATSWVGSDEWQGRSETAWFKARTLTHVGIAGYPRAPGCRVWAEFRTRDGGVSRIECPLVDPREEWNVWEIWRPRDAAFVRIVAEDHSSAVAGWVAFSHPFRAWPGALTAGFQLLQVITTTALALTLIWGPGLCWFHRSVAPPIRLVQLLGAGPLALALGGIAVWTLSGWLNPQYAGLAFVTGLWISIGMAGLRRKTTAVVNGAFGRMLGVSALLALAAIAKSSYSVGPQGELFRGTVSRNMEMTDRIDSRFSFYVVQAAAHHWGPASPATEGFFAPWTFFSRGPLAGLAAIPVVMATNGQPPAILPESRWSPFDRAGFAAYRITMIVLASTIVVALFLALVPLMGERWAMVAGGLLALTPFAVHEIMFTWPKWMATSWLLASFRLAHARHPLAAGLALAVGFLFHPLALLWSPWIALWAAGRGRRQPEAVAGNLIRFALGAGILVGPWMTLGALMPHLPTTTLAGQAGFVRYWVLADWQTATWSSWRTTRWMNFANTFVPLHLYLDPASFNHPKLGSAYEASGRLVKFAEVWWNSLPFGLGLGLWALSLAAFVRGIRTRLAPFVLFAAAPALLITAYWGMDPLGLMRECGHPLFIGIIALTVLVTAEGGGILRTILLHPARPWLQLPETWLMLWLTTFANPAPWATAFAHLDAVYFALSTAALIAAAWVLSRGAKTVPGAEAPSASLNETIQV